jgi:poly(3-hydroxybutyrate) depolymerase
LHIALHGCNQQYSAIGTAFIEHAGYNGWAEANNIIVVYPQTAASYFFPYNPEGCFDWWGFTNAYYAVKGGPQIAFIEKIIDAFASS